MDAARTARRLGATAELDPLLETIAAAATAVLDCERASVFLLDRAAGELSSRVATGIADSPVKEIRFPIGVGIAGEVARTGTVVNLPDAYADPRFNPEFDRRSGFHTRSMLAVPLADHDGTTVGVLQVLNKRGGSFGPRDEQLAGFLGGQAGVAVQRQLLLAHYAEKQRIERDLAIARDIQQRLLPKDAPVVPGFDIATWYAIWAPPRTPAQLPREPREDPRVPSFVAPRAPGAPAQRRRSTEVPQLSIDERERSDRRRLELRASGEVLADRGRGTRRCRR
jgi:signal transduction protein with GAF and PtsI domain